MWQAGGFGDIHYMWQNATSKRKQFMGATQANNLIVPKWYCYYEPKFCTFKKNIMVLYCAASELMKMWNLFFLALVLIIGDYKSIDFNWNMCSDICRVSRQQPSLAQKKTI